MSITVVKDVIAIIGMVLCAVMYIRQCISDEEEPEECEWKTECIKCKRLILYREKSRCPYHCEVFGTFDEQPQYCYKFKRRKKK